MRWVVCRKRGESQNVKWKRELVLQNKKFRLLSNQRDCTLVNANPVGGGMGGGHLRIRTNGEPRRGGDTTARERLMSVN